MKPAPLSPHLQIYKIEWTSTLSILHRLTGMGLVTLYIGFVWALWALAGGEEAYTQFVAYCATNVGRCAAILIVFSLVFHGLNGVRHLFWDIGIGFGLGAAFRSGMAVVLGTAFLTLLFAWRVFS